MSPLLVAVSLSALPCGLTFDHACEGVAADAAGNLQCWELTVAGIRNWSHETTWLDPSTCKGGRVLESAEPRDAIVPMGVPKEPPAELKLDPAIQARLMAAILPPKVDPKNPAHALARLRSSLPQPKQGQTTVLPALQWWPGPVPQPVDTARPSDHAPERGICPCHERFAGSRFRLTGEWTLGTQTLSVWNTGKTFAIAITEEGGKRHRWIHLAVSDKKFEPHAEDTRWYLATSHLEGKVRQHEVRGYDAKTGKAWQVNLPSGTSISDVSDAGVTLGTLDATSTQQPWSSFAPK